MLLPKEYNIMQVGLMVARVVKLQVTFGSVTILVIYITLEPHNNTEFGDYRCYNVQKCYEGLIQWKYRQWEPCLNSVITEFVLYTTVL